MKDVDEIIRRFDLVELRFQKQVQLHKDSEEDFKVIKECLKRVKNWMENG